ncbi:hypothetical protein OGAPHI_005177 [Ogataea philodendri]|uniref:Uncharacterized protein n=1 Tax=Ogataea philodendri TaxID=1378263 RepID=A0A9P8P2A2_9ASCO|nr:uncharacterized protein OGAPHI_005177 [Ogataea philodendri]KAH3663774.1 hypothetical protein OGAPHI_005177 [Ogataea philodendri]
MLHTAGTIVDGLVDLTNHLRLTETPDCIESFLWVSDLGCRSKLRVGGLVQQDFTTVHANALANFLDLCNKTDVENWFGKLDVTEMSWTFLHIFGTGLTPEVSVNRTQTRII